LPLIETHPAEQTVTTSSVSRINLEGRRLPIFEPGWFVRLAGVSALDRALRTREGQHTDVRPAKAVVAEAMKTTTTGSIG
jgi:hypothetical protein